MAQVCVGALRRCSDLARAVLGAVSAAAVGNSPQLPGELNSLRHLRRWRVDAAVALPVAEVKDEANQEPNDQPHPICPTEAVDHRAARDDPEYRDEWRRRYAESPF